MAGSPAILVFGTVKMWKKSENPWVLASDLASPWERTVSPSRLA